MTDENYNQEYYEKNKGQLSDKKKKKYKGDSEYREKIIENSRKRAVSIEKPYRPAMKRQPKSCVMPDGTRMYSIAFIAKRVRRSVQAVRKWEKEGIMPMTPHRSSSGMRLYSQEMIDAVVEAVQKRGMARLPNKDETICAEIVYEWKKAGVEVS